MSVLSPDERKAIEELFESIQLGRVPEGQIAEPFVEVGIRPGEMFHLIGKGFFLLRRLARDLSRPALTSGGLSPETVESRLEVACLRYLEAGPQKALGYLENQLAGPLDPWLVARPVVAAMRSESLEVGRCLLSTGLPPPLSGDWPEHFAERFPRHSLSTVVEARDDESALLLAEQSMLEAISILRLTDWGWRGRPDLGSFVAMESSRGFQLSTAKGRAVSATNMVRDSRFSWPHIAALDEAARKPVKERTDWERRTLAAARWLDEAASTGWPSDSLVCLMVGLEALFVARRGRSKGATIAREVSARWIASEMSAGDTARWLEDLYDSRSDAVHEGHEYENDLDVARLRLLVWEATSWAAGHLRQFHGLRDRPCRTQEEALADHG
jgi:hypothetical protein